MFIVSVTVRRRGLRFSFVTGFLASLFCRFSFSCSVTILGLGSFLVLVLLVLYFYFLEVPQLVLPMRYGTSNCNWTSTIHVVRTWYYTLVDSCLYGLCSEWDSVGLQ